MKNLLKSNYKIIIGFVFGIIVSCSVVYATSIGSASEVTYTPSDTTWNVSDVKSALDSLLTQLSTKLTERYNAGVTQGHTDRDTGVTVTAASQVLNGYKARTSSGTLVTGTDSGYTAGVTQGESNMKSGVTVTAASQILSGYKARNASGTLITGTATSGKPVSVSYITNHRGTGSYAFSFTATSGAIYAIAGGGSDSWVPTSLDGSGFTTLSFKAFGRDDSDKRMCFLAIIQATSTTVRIDNGGAGPYHHAVIVTKVTGP